MNFEELIQTITNSNYIYKVLIYILAITVPSVLISAFTKLIAGKQQKKVKVLNKERIRSNYKLNTLIRYSIVALYTITFIARKDFIFGIISTVLTTIFIFNDILKSKNEEIAIECKNGIIYRGIFYKWEKIICHNETTEYKEISLNKHNLYYYIDET